MPPRKTPSPSAGDQAEQSALVGYQTAITLWTYEGSQNWARFNVMLVANSIVMAVLGLTLTSGQSLLVATLILSVVGMVVCAAWFLMTKRGFDTQKYYTRAAREIEETYLAGTITTVSRGAALV